MDGQRSCWTCKARKTKCDGAVPRCNKCIRTRRECQGYLPRLSWPRAQDGRRSITGNLPVLAQRFYQGKVLFLNTTYIDIELYFEISPQVQPLQPTPDLCLPARPDVSHANLIRHFRDTAYRSLVTFTDTNVQIRDALLRIARTPWLGSGPSLLTALLAFSSLHRNGPHQQATRLKISALQLLSTSVNGKSLNPVEATQNAASSMLLASFEILQASGNPCEWLSHIRGAMDTIQATSLRYAPYDSDLGLIIDWVYYHDALSRFTASHWRHKSVTYPNNAETRDLAVQNATQFSSLTNYRPALPCPNPTYAIMSLLSEACDWSISWDAKIRENGHFDSLAKLEKKARGLVLAPAHAQKADVTMAAELHLMATRVYLTRAAQRYWEPSSELDDEIEKIFNGIINFCVCIHFFPLFVLACEASTDERRAAIIKLIERTEASDRARNLGQVKDVIRSIWAQVDLHSDTELLLNYVGLISNVISSHDALPPLF